MLPSYGYSSPQYSYALPAYALPVYGAAATETAFPHWRSPRHFMNRHRRRVHALLGQDLG